MRVWNTKKGCKILRVLSGRSNVFLLSIQGEHILVDSGPRLYRRRLENALAKLNVTRLKYLILTHSHFDHAGNACFVKNRYDAEVIIHEQEASFIGQGENVPQHGTYFFSRIILKLFGKIFLLLMKYEPCKGSIIIKDEMKIDFHGSVLQVIHTPGHTRGSISVIIDDEIALVGDTMFGIIISSVYPPFAENITRLIESWGRLLEFPCNYYLPSHGDERKRQLLEKELKKRKTS
jgi:hydroxyacylglutathione hydrolase